MLVLASGLGVLLALAVVAGQRHPARPARPGSPPAGLFPLRGRWLGYLLLALPWTALVPFLRWPECLFVPLAGLLTVGWWRLREELDDPRGPKIKSIDVGTGILLLSETAGPVPEDLRFELELWQRAGAGMLADVPWNDEDL